MRRVNAAPVEKLPAGTGWTPVPAGLTLGLSRPPARDDETMEENGSKDDGEIAAEMVAPQLGNTLLIQAMITALVTNGALTIDQIRDSRSRNQRKPDEELTLASKLATKHFDWLLATIEDALSRPPP